MRDRPLNHDELIEAQTRFDILPDAQKLKLLELQARIEECEGVDMSREIVGGIPFEHWCTTCKRTYSRMYILLDKWFVLQVTRLVNEGISRNQRGRR